MKKISIFILLISLSYNIQSQNKKTLIRDGNNLYNDSSYNMAEMQYRKSLEKDQDYFNASFNLVLRSPEVSASTSTADLYTLGFLLNIPFLATKN